MVTFLVLVLLVHEPCRADPLWSELISQQRQRLARSYQNGVFRVRAFRGDIEIQRSTIRFREGWCQVETQFMKEPLSISVHRPDAHFGLYRDPDRDEWLPKVLDAKPKGMLDGLVEPFFSFACRGLSLDELTHANGLYDPKSKFDGHSPYEVSWSYSAPNQDRGSMIFDEKSGWSCVSFTSERIGPSGMPIESVIQAKYSDDQEFPMLESMVLDQSNAQTVFTMERISSEPPAREIFFLDHYGLPEQLLRYESDSGSGIWIVFMAGIGIALLAVGVAVRRLGPASVPPQSKTFDEGLAISSSTPVSLPAERGDENVD